MDMETEIQSPLLSLPDGVENLLLSFVSTGEGGLQSILNLRQVCTTTKSWVDNLPVRQAKPIFSKAIVVMNSDGFTPKYFIDELRQFLKCPPPVAITALTLNTQGFYKRYRSEEENQLWSDFFNFWSSKLDTLQLVNERNYRQKDENHPWTLQLLDIPTLRNLATDLLNEFHWDSLLPFPLALRQATKLDMPIHFNANDNNSKHQFYSEILKNSNLKEFSFYPNTNSLIADLEFIWEFIEVKKNDSNLALEVNSNFVPFPAEVCPRCFGQELRPAFIGFVKSMADSKSEIRLKLVEQVMDCFEDLTSLVENDYQTCEFLQRVTEIESWKCREELLPRQLQGSLQRLDVIEKIESLDVQPGTLEAIRFPETLRELGIVQGFPSPRFLPQNMTRLKLDSVSSDEGCLMSSLTELSSSCACLETLELTWSSKKTAVEVLKSDVDDLGVETQESVGIFKKLRSLKFTAKLGKDEDGESAARKIILKGFCVGSLELLSLGLHFHVKNLLKVKEDKMPSVLNEDLLNELCEGKVGSSLVAFSCDKASVTPGGRPLLKKLKTKTSENRKRREETIGRKEW